MAKDPEALLADLYQKKRSCTLSRAEAALRAWRFQPGKHRGKAQVWRNGAILITLHRPHGKHMDPGAVQSVIRGIEAVRLRERGADGEQDF